MLHRRTINDRTRALRVIKFYAELLLHPMIVEKAVRERGWEGVGSWMCDVEGVALLRDMLATLRICITVVNAEDIGDLPQTRVHTEDIPCSSKLQRLSRTALVQLRC